VILEITPPSAGADRRAWGWQPVAAYATGLMGSATAVGAIVGAIGASLRVHVAVSEGAQHLWFAGIAFLAFAYGLHEMAIIRLPMPQVRWQVPACWTRYGKTIQAALYGTVLGAEVCTLIPYATFYILVLFDMTAGGVGGALLGCLYGTARVSTTVIGIAMVRQHGTPNRVIGGVTCAMGRFGGFHQINGVVLTAVGIVLGGMLLGL